MYQMMYPYWTDVARDQSGSESENKFAERLCAIDRVVVSTTLDAEDAKTRIIRTSSFTRSLQGVGGRFSPPEASMNC